ncbi:S-methylmethionine--homocysteine S-methyltransferase BHMT2, partial [Galemys pyrenaicus]
DILQCLDSGEVLHMEFLRAGANVMQTFAFSASEDSMEISVGRCKCCCCDLAREVANKGDALVAVGICHTSTFKHHKNKPIIKKIFQFQLEVLIRKNVDFLTAELWAQDQFETMELMKEGLQTAGLKVHIMVKSLGFHTPNCNKGGFVDLPEYPCGKLSTGVATRWDIQKYAREAYNWGSGTLVRAVDLSPTTSGLLQRSWCLKGDFLPPASENHGSWGSGLLMYTKSWIRVRAKREYWENLLPASGRPFCPSLSKPDT